MAVDMGTPAPGFASGSTRATRGEAIARGDSSSQCDISTGTVIASSIVRVTPPRTASCSRAWPYAPMTIRSAPLSALRAKAAEQGVDIPDALHAELVKRAGP